jgi:type VI secretion system protein ImpE
MTPNPSTAEQRLREGDPLGALALLQEQVRFAPTDARLRLFLFQLLCVLGQWERALTQLDTAAELDPAARDMAQVYTGAIRAEAVRRSVFAGTTAPLLHGDPSLWLAVLIESRLAAGAGESARAAELRARAFEEAPVSGGTIDGSTFEWVADADSRLGPVLEAIVGGRYYWVPFASLRSVTVERPHDLRDLVWVPVHLEFADGEESAALVPTRYPGSESVADSAILLGRQTRWTEAEDDVYHGLGQRVFATDAQDVPLLQVRSLVIADTVSLEERHAAHG